MFLCLIFSVHDSWLAKNDPPTHLAAKRKARVSTVWQRARAVVFGAFHAEQEQEPLTKLVNAMDGPPAGDDRGDPRGDDRSRDRDRFFVPLVPKDPSTRQDRMRQRPQGPL